MRIGLLVCICLSIMVPGRGVAGGDSTLVRETNVELLQRTVGESVGRIIVDGKIGPGERIAVKSPRDENSWLVDQSAFAVLTSHGIRVFSSSVADSSSADARLELVPILLSVRYSPVFHDGLFGEAKTERSVEGKFSASLINRDGSVRLSKLYSRIFTDTIAVEAIPSVDHPSLKIARGDPPAQGIFDALLAPVVILGSLAIAVYLLFTVRS